MQKASDFSALKRAEVLRKIQKTYFDLAIIGGGVTGAGIALDAASRGLNVCLVEKNDFASGTSNKSTKLIHGGLRYLKQFEIGLVRESGSERAIVHRLAPHLVIPEKMLLPLVKGGTYGKMMTAIGLQVYDFLADVKGNDRRKMLDKEETLSKEPLLNEEVVLGGGLYAEYRTDDARLTIEILKKAASLGATIVNYCEMESFDYDENSKIKNLNCKDHNTGNSFQIKARNYVSAAGPWVDKLRTKDQSLNNKYLHLTKGVHIVFPQDKLPVKQPLYFDVPDGRMIFAIPRGRVTYVGTTDTNYSGSLDRVVATKDDARYILDAVNDTFPSVDLTIDDIASNWAGLRPLIHEEDKDPSELSRKDEIFISDSGLVSIAGGKLTGYRKMAERVIEAVLKTLKKKDTEKLKKSNTAKISLVSPSLENSENVRGYQSELAGMLKELGVFDDYHAWYLCTTYGKQSEPIIEKSKEFDNQDILERLVRAEFWFCVQHEMTNNMSDFFVRRTGRLYFNVASVSNYKSIILEDCISYFNWDQERIVEETNTINTLLQDATNFYDEDFK
jgi:glycerol-3-phosphate dehydrogenase